MKKQINIGSGNVQRSSDNNVTQLQIGNGVITAVLVVVAIAIVLYIL